MAYDHRQTDRGIAFGPPPQAFPLSDHGPGERDTMTMGDRGLCYWLSDTLVDATGLERIHSSRVIQQVTGTDGLQRAASVEILFNPHYERVVVHRVRVTRGDSIRDVGTPEAFEVFRRELNLERAIYDGRVTAHMLIPDVRIGDLVDVAYSIYGANPALKDALSCFFTLQWSAPTIETRCRVRASRTRRLTIRAYGDCPPAQDEAHGDVRELTWRVIDAPTYRHDADAPGSYIGYSAIRIADEAGWNDVAALFQPYYADHAALPTELIASVDDLARTHDEPARRAAEALRLVQRALRYHSISVGEGGYRPREIAAIWETRYGDCKDASRLLTAILTRLGLEACPALVNTWAGDTLDTVPPNPTAFDHCIVRVVVDGKVWWMDPTCAPQSGRLDRIAPALHYWALPLVEGTAALERLADRPVVFVMDAHEDWTFSRIIGEPAQLTITTEYRGWKADAMRRWRENDGPTQVARQMREGLENHYGTLTEASPLEWNDQPDENLLRMVESYAVERPFILADDGRTVRIETRDDVVIPNLRTVESPRRLEPIALGNPARWRVRSTFHFPVDVAVTPWAEDFSGPGVRGRSAFSWSEDRTGQLELDLEIQRPTVPAESAPAFFAFKRKMISMNGLTLVLPVSSGKLQSRSSEGLGWQGWAVLAILAALFIATRIVAN